MGLPQPPNGPLPVHRYILCTQFRLLSHSQFLLRAQRFPLQWRPSPISSSFQPFLGAFFHAPNPSLALLNPSPTDPSPTATISPISTPFSTGPTIPKIPLSPLLFSPLRRIPAAGSPGPSTPLPPVWPEPRPLSPLFPGKPPLSVPSTSPPTPLLSPHRNSPSSSGASPPNFPMVGSLSSLPLKFRPRLSR